MSETAVEPLDTSPALAGAAARSRWRAGAVYVGGFLVALVVVTALVSYVWTPYDPTAVNPPDALAGVSARHWMGADQFGRDIFSQVMAGARNALFVGIIAVVIAAAAGVPLGALAAQRGGWLAEVVMRFNDVLFAFPPVLMAVLLAAGFGASTLTAMVAIGVAYVPVFARLTRGSALQALASDYVLAARVSGRRPLAIMVRHVLPNIVSVLIVQATVLFSLAILAEAALSYLGLGTPPPTPSWGRMLHEAQTYLSRDQLLALWPGLSIALAVLGFNLLGDGLRDVFDPKLQQRSR